MSSAGHVNTHVDGSPARRSGADRSRRPPGPSRGPSAGTSSPRRPRAHASTAGAPATPEGLRGLRPIGMVVFTELGNAVGIDGAPVTADRVARRSPPPSTWGRRMHKAWSWLLGR